MAFRTATALARGFIEAQSEARNIKAAAARARGLLASASQSADFILGIHRAMVTADTNLATQAAITGMADYAKSQVSDPAYDIVAEFQALRAAVQAVRDSIETTIPKDGSGYFLIHQFAGNQVTPRMFTVAQTASLRNLLQTVENAVA